MSDGTTVDGGGVATLRDRLGRAAPGRRALAYWAMVVNAEFLLVAGYYLLATDVTVKDPLYTGAFAAVPFVWINLAAWAVTRTDPPAASTRKKAVAAAVAVGYFLLLAAVGGVINGPSALSTWYLNVLELPPGWNPALFYNTSLFSLNLLPYKVVGFAALAYLVYATALDAAGALVGGVLGFFSCVSCTFPIVAGVASGLVGGGSVLAGLATLNSYLLSTVVFAVTVLLLSWRPTAG